MSNEEQDLSETPRQVRRDRSPDHSIKTEGPVATATIHDRTALYISIFAMVLSALCLGLFLMQTFLMPQIIDARVLAGMAEARAGMQQQVATAQATATAGQQHARVALDKVEDFRAKLAEKGIKIEPLDGH